MPTSLDDLTDDPYRSLAGGGRYGMAHTGATIWDMFDEPDVQNYMGVLAPMHWSYDRYDKTARRVRQRSLALQSGDQAE